MTNERLLSVREVSKSFGAFRAVSGVSFDVMQGETLGMAGPNGAGKSTLFNLLTGVPFGPDSGEIQLDGKKLNGRSPQHICRAGMARTFQTEAVFDSLTVAENLRVSAKYSRSGFGHRLSKAEIEQLMGNVGLEQPANRLASELSLFDKKRLMIANALSGEPKILLMDEPASGLNPDDQKLLIALIEDLKGRGLAVIVIEHVLSVLRQVADRILVLSAGEVLAEGDPKQVLSSPEVIQAYLGERASQQ